MTDDDALGRERARTVFDRPVILEAGAGTGKTTTLIVRICTWCLGPGWDAAARPGDTEDQVAARTLDGVVAITFTEAAAAEMAERLGEALARVSRGEEVKGFDVLPVPSAVAQRRARALLGAVDRIVLSTIHAFCARLLAASPTEAQLHPAHVVDADGRRLREVVHEVVIDWFTRLFSGSVDPERGRLVELAKAGVRSETVIDAVVAFATKAVPAAALRADPMHPEALRALAERARSTADTWLAHVGVHLDEVRAARPLLLATRALQTCEPSIPALRIAVQAFGDGRGSPLDVLTALGRAVPDAHEIRVALQRCPASARIHESRRLLDTVRHVRNLQPELLLAARTVVADLLEPVEHELRRRGIVTFDALLRDARDLLARDPAVRDRVRAGMRQLLVDEFQDTDAVQCDIVRMLALEGDRRPGLFIVGDPKQSIYGWRSADLVAYQAFVDAVTAGGGVLHRLSVNRRSHADILAEVDRVVGHVMAPEHGYQPEFQPLRAAGTASAPPKPWNTVEYWVSWRVDPSGVVHRRALDATAIEPAALAADIARVRAATQCEWSDFALLFRTATDLDQYMSKFRDAGIPYAVERTNSYFRRREIIDAIALVRCILEPEDTLALLTVLRSPLVGVPDAALLPLWAERLPTLMANLHGDDALTLETLRLAAEGAARAADQAAPPGIERVRGWPDLLVEAAAHIGWLRSAWERLPVDRFVAELRERLPLEACAAGRYLGDYRLANLSRFYADLVPALARGDSASALRALRDGLAGRREADDARPGDATARAVRVMTIHKSKGLEFPHVYLPQLHRGRRETNDRPALDEFDAREHDGRWEYKLFGTRSLGWDRVHEHVARIEQRERVRLLYVAMTRAKSRLVLIGAPPEKWTPSAEPVTTATSLLDLVLARPDVPSLDTLQNVGMIQDGAAVWRLADDTPADRVKTAPREWSYPPVDAARWTQRVERAEATMRRPFSRAASEMAHGPEPEPARAGGSADGAAIAAAVGTAVHAALEHMDAAASASSALTAAQTDARASLDGAGLDAAARAAAEARAAALIARFVRGPLGERFRALRRHIVARELPLLAAPPDGADAPVGFVAGAIDMLYEDPATGAYVVVDYKTDHLPDAEARDARVARYALQAGVYTAAVRDALDLRATPRAELWFLTRDEIVSLE